MFARASAFFLCALPLVAAATIPASQCNTANLQCCQSTEHATNLSQTTTTLLGLLGVIIGDITAHIGLTCGPISVIGIGGTSCAAQPVCCTDNGFHGLIALGCTPVNLNL
ncbi:Fruiting body protein SC3 [Hypsizygus marmoreus]|uniref:Hydrophobin n=1 Tax=Hypsizygus marmoreus TaxID=39966 RepID=A0A369K1D7_HYPMA|nr:Fruiting body protein SC3 [Hypsizygus marmoreus]